MRLLLPERLRLAEYRRRGKLASRHPHVRLESFATSEEFSPTLAVRRSER